MKIKTINISEAPLLGKLTVDFTGSTGKILDTIVLAGVNGSGKTTLLRTIFDIFELKQEEGHLKGLLEIDVSHLPGYEREVEGLKLDFGLGATISTTWERTFEQLDEKIRPRVIYMPTEINFDALKVKNLSFTAPYSFRNIVNQGAIHDVPSFIATAINNEVYREPDQPAKRAIAKVCNEINVLFIILEIDVRMIGLSPEGERLPIFKNGAGKVFDINNLSSGEKQLFVRAMALRMLNANNSIILIDEPEISMHPAWQQRIVDVYQKIGQNNQLIFATHSPHVVASVPKESVKLLKREDGQIKMAGYEEFSGSLGLPVDIVLKDLMGLKTLRDPKVDKELKDLWALLHQGRHESEDFKKHYRELEQLLGSEDEDLLLMRIEIAKSKAAKGKNHAENSEAS